MAVRSAYRLLSTPGGPYSHAVIKKVQPMELICSVVAAKKQWEEDDRVKVGQNKSKVMMKKPQEARATTALNTSFALETPLHITCQCYLYLLYHLKYTKLIIRCRAFSICIPFSIILTYIFSLYCFPQRRLNNFNNLCLKNGFCTSLLESN